MILLLVFAVIVFSSNMPKESSIVDLTGESILDMVEDAAMEENSFTSITAQAFLDIFGNMIYEEDSSEGGIYADRVSCSDSDGGLGYDVVGYVSGRNRWGRRYNRSDSCLSGDYEGYVRERYCDGNEARARRYQCPYGCEDGACKLEPKPECTESDKGKDYYLKGITSICYRNEPDSTCKAATDMCKNNDELVEYYCNEGNNDINMQEYVCPNGCKDGACIKSKKPYCSVIGTRSEGWYQYDGLVKYDNCNGCYAVCKAVGTRSEGWYSSCTDELIKWERCGEEQTCTDSDRGKNYYKKGTVTKGGRTETDECAYCTGLLPSPVTCGAVKEFYCQENNIKNTTYVCPNKCENSACIKCAEQGEMCGGIAGIECCSGLTCQLEGSYPDASGTCISPIKCTDSDGGKNYYKKGVTYGRHQVGQGPEIKNWTDYCTEKADALIEFSCRSLTYPNSDPLDVWSDYYNCPNGCRDGVCINCASHDISIIEASNFNGKISVSYKSLNVAGQVNAELKIIELTTPTSSTGGGGGAGGIHCPIMSSECETEEEIPEAGSQASSGSDAVSCIVYTNCSWPVYEENKEFYIRLIDKKCPHVYDELKIEQEPTSTCTDTDNGLKYHVKGTTIGTSSTDVEYGTVEKTDFCAYNNKVHEYYCENNVVVDTEHTCQYSCEDGACVECSKIEKSSNHLEFNENINSIQSSLTSSDLYVLLPGSISNEHGTFSYAQTIFLPKEASLVFEADNDHEEPGPDRAWPYVKIEGNSLVADNTYRYDISFSPALKSDHSTDLGGYLEDILNKNINIVRDSYTITQADHPSQKRIIITFTSGSKRIKCDDPDTSSSTIHGTVYVGSTDMSGLKCDITTPKDEGVFSGADVEIKAIEFMYSGGHGHDIYIAAGESAAERAELVDDQVGNFLNRAFDFRFGGLEVEGSENIELIPSGSYNYKLSFTNKAGITYNQEVFAYDGTAVKFGRYTGATMRDIVTSENTAIADENYFVVSRSEYSRIMQFKDIDPGTSTRDNAGIIKIKDTGTGELIEVIYSYITGRRMGYLRLDGNEFKIFVTQDSNAGKIMVDFDGSGTIGDLTDWCPQLFTNFGAEIKLCGLKSNTGEGGFLGSPATYGENTLAIITESLEGGSHKEIMFIGVKTNADNKIDLDDSAQVHSLSVTGPTYGTTTMLQKEDGSYVYQWYSRYGVFLEVDRIGSGATQNKFKASYPYNQVFGAFFATTATTYVCEIKKSCTDSDGGKDYYTKGFVSVFVGHPSDGYHYDACYGDRLAEYFCNEDGTLGSTGYDCPNGCSDGACINETVTCTDSDGGKNYYVKGTLTSPDKSTPRTDYCTDEPWGSHRANLIEYYCTSETTSASYGFECPNGCEDGACKPEPSMTLADYPSPFVINGQLNSLLVIGRSSVAEDVLASVDIINALPLDARGSGAAVLDSEVADIDAQNIISVGGPCSNTVSAYIMGNPANCLDGFEPGKARIRLHEHANGKFLLLVAGYSGMDTRKAGRVLGEYEQYNLEDCGTEAIVSGTSLTDISVSCP